jgi:hypothetical protein
MQSRLKALQRIALAYMAMKHAQALSLEQAAAAVRETESLIERQKTQARRSDVAGREALDAGEHVAWRMHESQKQFTEWNAEGLVGLREQREALMFEAAEVYRAGRMQLEQMESVLRELRSKLDVERAHKAQRESDDRFLSQQWWRARDVAGAPEDGPGA